MKQGRLHSLHADQVIASIVGRTENHALKGVERVAGFCEVRHGEQRHICANEDCRLAAAHLKQMLQRGMHPLAQVVAGLRHARQRRNELADFARSLDRGEEQHHVDIPDGRNSLDGVGQQRAAEQSKAIF